MKEFMKKCFNIFGYNLTRLQPSSDNISQVIAAIHKIETSILLDIGANAGQFAMEVRRKGYKGKIISFEPLSSARNELLKQSSKDDKWQVHERAAIGNYDGEVDINISKNSYSSSILPMFKSHSDVAKDSVYIDKEKTPVIKLDSIISNYLNRSDVCFIKIDTQGYEWQVLDGAQETLKKTDGIICELSFIPLYEGQHLWKEIISRLENEGFVLWSLIKGFTDKNSGRSLQMDGVFLKKSNLKNIR